MYFNKKNYVVVIPSYNEIKTLPKIIEGIIKKNIQVIVIDDNSNDNSFNMIKKYNIIIIRNKIRLGYEKSLNKGFKHANNKNYKYLLTFDADGQHNINDIERIFKKLVNKKNIIVVGERNKKQRIFENIFEVYTRIFFNIRDPLSGLKAINLEKIKLYHKNIPFNNCGTQLLLQCLIKKLKIGSINITIKKRYGKPKYGNILTSNLKIFFSLINFIHNQIKI
tara:strand:+ start:7727 stop:8392 length:666 start_codon:yes stop_codon:yes gene_type:complete